MKVLFISRVDLMDADKVEGIIKGLHGLKECVICMFIDEKEIAYAETKIVNAGWVGEKIGGELIASLNRAFRQEAYLKADELEKQLKSHRFSLRILIETGNESEIYKRLMSQENPDLIYIFKKKESWLTRILKRKKYNDIPDRVKIITV